MKILSFSKAADVFGVSSATISRWVKAGKLKEGPKAGKQKTVTQKSVDTLASDSAFQIGRESAKSEQNKQRKTTQRNVEKEIEGLKHRVGALENLVESLSEEIDKMRKFTQNYTEGETRRTKNTRKITQNNVTKKGKKKIKKS